MSKVVLVDLDATRFGNLALMKLAAWHRRLGDGVELVRSRKVVIPSGDVYYASCVFVKNAHKVGLLAGLPVEVGGSGVDMGVSLPDDVEHVLPDYDLYGLQYSMGFTTRGCPRKCPFCIVADKEGSIRAWADWREFWDRRHDRVMLLDNNLLAGPTWRETLTTLAESGVGVDFNQGLDIRLVTDEVADLLVKCRTWRGKKGRNSALRFAFDSPELEGAVRRGIEMLLARRVNSRTLNFYVLVGFDTTFEENMARFRVLKEYHGVYAFPMFYVNRSGVWCLPAPAPAPPGRAVTRADLGYGAPFLMREYVNSVNRLNEGA